MILYGLDMCTYKVSSPYKVFSLLAVAIMFEKYLEIYRGVHPPLGCHGNLLLI